MRKILALIRASWLSAASYRLSMLISVGALMLTVLPLYYVATALQPTMADAIQNEGGHYFSFLLVGTIVYTLIIPALVKEGVFSAWLLQQGPFGLAPLRPTALFGTKNP